MTHLDNTALMESARNIKLVVFDVDGVMTDGRIFLSNTGDELKAFHAQDGLGLVMLQQTGCEIAIITARESEIVKQRMLALGITHVYQKVADKAQQILELIQTLGLDNKQVAYVGDDIIDLGAMHYAGLAIAVANAVDIVKEHAYQLRNGSIV